MADDSLIVVLAAALDIALTRGAKRHVWVRVLNAAMALLFIALVGAAIFITVKYS